MTKALIVDDSRTVRLILTRLLKEVGFQSLVEAGNGQEALDRLRDGKPEVVLVDWNMPIMNGYDFLVEMRSHRAYDEILVVMVTTESEMSQVACALEAGANEYIMKPFTKEVIQEKLELVQAARNATL
jgi:two-component system chemotaxis response regulator CheY